MQISIPIINDNIIEQNKEKFFSYLLEATRLNVTFSPALAIVVIEDDDGE